jgi:predicted nucleotidyltransferase
MNVYTIDEIRKRVAAPARRYGVKKVYLFGSYARGNATETSDIDLCVDSGGAIRTLFQLSGLYADMEDALQRKIDLVTMDSLDGGFKDAISREWKALYG